MEQKLETNDRPLGKVGGTDIAAILGVSPYGGPASVYDRIVHGQEKAQTKSMMRGRIFEPVARGMYLQETGAALKEHPGRISHPLYDWTVASLDDLVTLRDGSDVIVDYKTENRWASRKKGYGNYGTDAIPDIYALQLAWYMAVRQNEAVAHLFVVFGEDTWKQKTIPPQTTPANQVFEVFSSGVYVMARDLGLENMVIEAVKGFWENHIVPRCRPRD